MGRVNRIFHICIYTSILEKQISPSPLLFSLTKNTIIGYLESMGDFH